MAKLCLAETFETPWRVAAMWSLAAPSLQTTLSQLAESFALLNRRGDQTASI
jgi:hypothetical protein